MGGRTGAGDKGAGSAAERTLVPLRGRGGGYHCREPPSGGRTGARDRAGVERSGTPTVPLARVGRGFAQAIAERRSYSEAFGLWRCACERRKARGGRLEEGAHLRLFIHNIYYFMAKGQKHCAPLT
ncbi:hypothetical protein [Prevotella intermedia]|uniref:hypothetical protein n=1 Tax=Prevotella intermedia TaxID=28131 RepID=UPI0012FEB796|nr:hypothetical protein [Prevotella intermedia]